jgi:hypothetical protein
MYYERISLLIESLRRPLAKAHPFVMGHVTRISFVGTPHFGKTPTQSKLSRSRRTIALKHATRGGRSRTAGAPLTVRPPMAGKAKTPKKPSLSGTRFGQITPLYSMRTHTKPKR